MKRGRRWILLSWWRRGWHLRVFVAGSIISTAFLSICVTRHSSSQLEPTKSPTQTRWSDKYILFTSKYTWDSRVSLALLASYRNRLVQPTQNCKDVAGEDGESACAWTHNGLSAVCLFLVLYFTWRCTRNHWQRTTDGRAKMTTTNFESSLSDQRDFPRWFRGTQWTARYSKTQHCIGKQCVRLCWWKTAFSVFENAFVVVREQLVGSRKATDPVGGGSTMAMALQWGAVERRASHAPIYERTNIQSFLILDSIPHRCVNSVTVL